MQPWDFILISDAQIRGAVHDNFLECNRRAAERYEGERLRLYSSLTLAAILEAPLNLCVTCDHDRRTGDGLGRHSVPETDVYSTVCAVQNLWLAARAEGLGVGWVSILDPDNLRTTLRIPPTVTPVAYLCIGYVAEFRPRPDLQEKGWAGRESLAGLIHFEHWEGQDTARAADLIRSVVQELDGESN